MSKNVLWKITLALAALAAILSAGAAAWLLRGLPNVDSLPANLMAPSIRITDREGRPLYDVLPGGQGRQISLPLDKIPLALRQATIATEDRTFYTNPGIDAAGILRAAWINLRGGETLAGGSTITQQVVRTLLMNEEERGERTLRRKLRESVLAWQLTRRYSKDEILALYLNQTYFGAMAYGIEAAAWTYFGKPASQLDLAECALLAGLPQAPARYNPFTDMLAAKQRQAVVLGLMEKEGYLTSEERRLAEGEPLVLARDPYPLEAPHFVLWVRSLVDSLVTPQQLQASGGLVVRTTLDLDAQHKAEQAVANQLTRLAREDHNVNGAAVVALDPSSGRIVAMVGSPNYDDALHSGAVNMALAHRQPGSALKPFIYAAAFDPARPDPWTPATILLDVTTHFTTHEGRAYTPSNYDGLEHGPVRVREALASSLNIPAVIALDHIGIPELFRLLANLGVQTLGEPERYDLSIALGGGEVRLIDLTAAYGALANGGFRVRPYAIEEITGVGGAVLYRAPTPSPERILDPRVAWLISDILSDDEARSTGFARNSILRLDRPAAVKTGTTTNFHDNWTVGYTPDLVVGVWAGNPTHEAMRDVTGLTGAAPIWHQTIRALLAGTPVTPFTRPDGLEQVEICALSGLLPTPACPYRRMEWFIQGTAPRTYDPYYRKVEIDLATGRLADASTPPAMRASRVALDLPPRARPWARARGLLLVEDLLPPAGAPEQGSTYAGLQLLTPAAGAVYHLSAGLPPETQQLRLVAVGPNGIHNLKLWVDGAPIVSPAQSPYEGWWQLAAGRHTAWATATGAEGENLATDHVTFEVK